MQQIHDAINWLNGYLWGPPMLILLMGTHIFLTIRTGFIQRFIGLAISLSFKKDDKGIGDVSQFGALTTALAATIGTGNIVGVANRCCTWWPWCRVVDVAYGRVWYCLQIQRSSPCGKVSGEDI